MYNLIHNKSFDLSRSYDQGKIIDLILELSSKDIPIYCNPAFSNLSIEFFYDTEYHLNKKGTLIRSNHLAECIKNIEDELDDEQINFNEAIRIIKKEENELLRTSSQIN